MEMFLLVVELFCVSERRLRISNDMVHPLLLVTLATWLTIIVGAGFSCQRYAVVSYTNVNHTLVPPPLGNSIELVSNMVVVLDQCEATDGPAVLRIAAGALLAVSNVSITLRHCVGVLPQIAFGGESANISITLRNISLSSRDFSGSDTLSPLILFRGPVINVQVEMHMLSVSASDTLVLISSVSFQSNVTFATILLDDSVWLRRAHDNTPLIIVAGASLAFVDITISNVVMVSTFEAKYPSDGKHPAVLLEWDSAIRINVVSVVVVRSSVIVTITTDLWYFDMCNPPTVAMVRLCSFDKCSEASFFQNVSIRFLASNVSLQYNVTEGSTRLCEVRTSVVVVSAGVNTTCPHLSMIDELNVHVSDGVIVATATVNTQVLYIQPLNFEAVRRLTATLTRVRFIAATIGVSPDRTSTRSVAAISIGPDVVQANITVRDSVMHLNASAGNIPVPVDSSLFASSLNIWKTYRDRDNRTSSSISNFTNAGVTLFSLKDVLNSTINFVNTIVVGQLVGTMVNRAVTIPNDMATALSCSLLTARLMSLGGAVTVTNTTLTVVVGISRVDPVVMQIPGVMVPFDTILVIVSLLSLCTGGVGGREGGRVELSCRSSSTRLTWGDGSPYPPAVVVLDHLFVLLGKEILVSVVLNAFPAAWRGLVAAKISGISTASGSTSLQLNFTDITFDGCMLSLDLPPEASNSGNRAFASLVALPNVNRGTSLVVSHSMLNVTRSNTAPHGGTRSSMLALSPSQSQMVNCSVRFSGNVLNTDGGGGVGVGCICVSSDENCSTSCTATMDERSAMITEHSTLRGNIDMDAQFVMTSLRLSQDAAVILSNLSIEGMMSVLSNDVTVAAGATVAMMCSAWNNAEMVTTSDVGGTFVNRSSLVLEPCAIRSEVRKTTSRGSHALLSFLASSSACTTVVSGAPTAAAAMLTITQLLAMRLRCSTSGSATILTTDAEEPPPLSDAGSNPFDISLWFLGDVLTYAGGSVLSWFLVTIILMVVVLGLDIIQRGSRRAAVVGPVSWEMLSMFARSLQLPGSLYPGYLLLIQPWSAAVFVLLISSARTSASIAFGCVTAALVAGPAVLFLLQTLLPSRQKRLLWKRTVVNARSNSLECLNLAARIDAFLFANRWQCKARDAKDHITRAYAQRYSTIHSSFREGFSWFSLVEIGTAIVLGGLSGMIAALLGSGCDSFAVLEGGEWAIAAVNIGVLVTVAVLRPYSSVFANVQSCESALLTALSTMIVLLSSDDDAANAERAAVALTWVQSLLGFFPAAFATLRAMLLWGAARSTTTELYRRHGARTT